MLGKGNKLAILFSLVLSSSGLLGELSHDHNYEIHDAEHHEIEFHNECLTCTSDQVTVNLKKIHIFFSLTVKKLKTSIFIKKRIILTFFLEPRLNKSKP